MYDGCMTKEIFEKAPGISAPWFIDDGELGKDGIFHITIDFDDAAFPSMVDSVEMEWRHLSFFQYPSLITARIPRVKDERGKIRKVTPAWKKTVDGLVSMTS